MSEAAQASEPQEPRRAMPVGSVGRHALGWFGMWGLIATEGALFIYLLFSYFYLGSQARGAWPPGGPPHLRLAGPNTVLLLLSSVTFWWGEQGIKRGARGRLLLGTAATLVLAGIFVAVQLVEWRNKTFPFAGDLYGSLYFTITGFHMAHVVAGMVMLALVGLWSALGYFDRYRHAAVSISGLYWHFVDAVWLTVFFTFYVTPYLW